MKTKFQETVDRREFMKMAGYAGAGLCMSTAAWPGVEGGNGQFGTDRYGGWKHKNLSGTGYFRTGHDGNRWWFVTPDGNGFLSFGVNHYHEDWWRQKYNLAHWLNEFGAQNPGDDRWNDGFRKAASADLKRLGINTLGMHTDAAMLTDKPYGAVVPYLRSYKPIVLDHYRHPGQEAYVDVFAPGFEKLCDDTAQAEAAPYADDPMLLGYCMSDCPIFTDDDVRLMGGTATWPRVIKNLGPLAPGKQAYVACLEERYPDISAFNGVYGTEFGAWKDLLDAENWRPGAAPLNDSERADNESFMLLCVDRYYSVAKSALRRADPNHLFFGDKLNGNTDNLEKVVNVAARYADAILYQFYDRWSGHESLLDHLSEQTSLPCVNGDTGFSVPGEMMPDPYGPHAVDQAERAEWLMDCCERSFARPNFVGWHMCGAIDTWKTMPGKEVNQHQGLMTATGEFYPEMQSAVQVISKNLYQLANQNKF